ncbi:MAG: hypothetical protein WAZ18_01475 [Alphaproteobacteria bacterium]
MRNILKNQKTQFAAGLSVFAASSLSMITHKPSLLGFVIGAAGVLIALKAIEPLAASYAPENQDSRSQD